MQNIHQILKDYWGHAAFRPQQEEIIRAVLEGNDALAILPTGGGKSICFQVPAMAMDGICLVISPLIALMKDQVDNLRKKGITAFAIYAGMSRKEVTQTLQLAGNSNCKFLYVSPERLETRLFLEYLPSLPIQLIAVDEAHCISQWGYDFRPPYLRIAALREELPNIPVLALTASATAEVQQDICDKLTFKNGKTFRRSFERPALSYSVFKVDSKINKLVDILNKVPGTGLVYCKSRKRTKDIAEQLRSYNIQADFYNAGLSQEERSQKQQDWIQNKTRIIVCTNAFGMGIDKPDVRIVVHYDMPDCLENYYQEAGRAGRDEQKAYAVLLYQEKDVTELEAQSTIRFPPLATIRQVYQAVANYLQLPEGAGAGNYYPFDLLGFANTFKLDLFTVMHSLKVLEQEEYIAFNEQVFIPAKLQFTCNKEYLYAFENAHPDLEPYVKILLRSYEGIYDHITSINERSIAFNMREEESKVKAALQQLHQYGLVSYEPQKDTPQLYFIYNRVKTEQLTIDQQRYQRRKEVFEKRVAAFIEYVQNTTTCRSKMIGQYFGDQSIKDCGVCDSCLQKKTKTLTPAEFQDIQSKIQQLIISTPMDAQQLLDKLSGIPKEKAWQVLQFLQAENKIVVNATGIIAVR